MHDNANRLAREKSPYLLQHAYNPVDWFPWCEEAFEEARRENKPVFLSIGYSTCHWCHVMEKESFEDDEVAALMNQAFVSIKVDREERPDLDHVYMAVCQMMTGSGGWPLTIIMTPDKKPFFAATYIPKGSRFGRTGMVELIPRIEEVWKSRRGDVLESAGKITDALQQVEKQEHAEDLDREVLDRAFQELSSRFDKTYGGFGHAPKFPTPHHLSFLLRYWKRSGNSDALAMAEKTLQELRWGGIFDQIGFGFHRYSTDREWLVPHFEKMLYDQAMLALAYLEAYQATGNELHANTAREVFTYVLRDMRSPEGAFYSAEDADSEGVEGKFYTWTEEEIRQVLSPEEADLAIRTFQVRKTGNFKDEASGKSTGTNILYTGRSLSGIGAEQAGVEDRIENAREKLFQAREKRVHPHKDDKILTDWNGLMIAALARGTQVLGDRRYARAALQAAQFIMTRMRTGAGRLLHRYREGDAGITANADDYAFFVWGLMELYGATFDAEHLAGAKALMSDMISHFWDSRYGGFYFAPDDGEELIARKKEVYDGAIPSGNAVAMGNLLRLSRITGIADYEERASGITRAFSAQVKHFPSGYTQFLCSLDFALGPSYEVVVTGPADAPGTRSMLEALRKRFIPNQVTLFRASDADTSKIDAIAEFIRDHSPRDGEATAYVCLEQACRRPTTDIGEMLAFLESA